MLTWTLRAGAFAELSAFYDEELPVADRIAIADHLERCPSCRLEAADLMDIRQAMRDTARSDDVRLVRAAGLRLLQSDMLMRWEAEENASLGQRVRGLFDDPAEGNCELLDCRWWPPFFWRYRSCWVGRGQSGTRNL